MELKNYAIGLVIFGMVVLALGTFAGEMSSSYNTPIDTAFVQHYNNTNQMNGYASNLMSSISTKGITAGSFVGILLSGIGAFFSLLFSLATFPITLLAHVWMDIGLPASTSWIATGICTIIAITIIFSIVSSALKSKV